mmetsp:Transcript_9683/g.13556  ORF Transcript_9683/g.13556 Transcript_9683/m.13556 type:complete len:297 (-) Transcript_9683:114-1004(-)
MQRSLEARTAALDRDVRSALANEIESSLGMQNCDSHDDGDSDRDDEENSLEDNPLIQQQQDPDAVAASEETSRSLAELDIVLSKCRSSLAKFERAEKFVSIRVNSYRKMLSEQSARFSSENYRERKARESGSRRRIICETREEDELEEEIALTSAGHDSELGGLSQEEKERQQRFEEEEKEKLLHNKKSLEKVEETHRTMVENISSMKLRIATLERKREEIILARNECRDFLVAAAEAEEYEMAGQVVENDEERKDGDEQDDLEAGRGNGDAGVARESEMVGLGGSPSDLLSGEKY